MLIRCIIITYLLIFPTNRISEGKFLAESYVEAFLNMLAWSNLSIPNLFLCIFCFVNFLCILLFLFLMYFIVFMIFFIFVI